MSDSLEKLRKASRKELKERQALRLAFKLNPPVKGPRGLSNLVKMMSGRRVHSLFCRCNDCLPPEMQSEPSAEPTFER